MELWLLVGAVILVALTVWIVWPVQRTEEVTITPMTNSNSIPPQGDKLEDQHPSATANLSAGGVAATLETSAQTASAAAGEAWSSTSAAREGIDQAFMPSDTRQPNAFTRPRTLGVGATAVLAIAGGIGGAWLYQRSQRERNRPINRLRRRAQVLTGRLPDMNELPNNSAPIGSAAAALVATSLLVARARRRGEPDLAQRRDVVLDAVEQGRERARRLRVPDVAAPPRQTILGGLGVGGTAMVIGAVWLIWRLLKGNNQQPRHLYTTDRMGE